MQGALVLSSRWHSSIGDLENTSRVILIVCNAAITHPPMCHDWVEAGIVERGSGTADRWFGEAVDGRISAVFLLDGTSLSVAHE